MGRTAETLPPAHGTDRGTLRWLAIAWGKQNGHVPQDLNRTDKHGNEIPYWVSGMLWDLQGDKLALAWHRRWRAILAGLLAECRIRPDNGPGHGTGGVPRSQRGTHNRGMVHGRAP